jgi:RimJ/RimL family protein N-acetyltransferase
MRRAVSAAFGELEGVERVEALVDADDAPARRVLEDAGFLLEAVLRSYRAVEGKLRDVAVYSLVSTDPHLD